jgi:hypothetical protein
VEGANQTPLATRVDPNLNFLLSQNYADFQHHRVKNWRRPSWSDHIRRTESQKEDEELTTDFGKFLNIKTELAELDGGPIDNLATVRFETAGLSAANTNR